jgi:NTE family protein
VNPLPVNVVRQLGADFVIASSLFTLPTNDGDGHASPMPDPFEGQREIGILDVLARSSTVMQARLAEARLRAHPPDLMIVPQVADVGMFDLHRSTEVIEAGRQAARRALPAIHAALRQRDRGGDGLAESNHGQLAAS